MNCRLVYRFIRRVGRRLAARRLALTFLLAIWLISTATAHAQTLTWDPNGNGTDGSGNWDTTSSFWSPNLTGGGSDTTWINGDTAAFGYAGGSGGNVTLTTATTPPIAGLVFNTDPGAFTFAGSPTLTLGSGGITVAATDGTETFGNTLAIALSATQNWTNNSTTGTLTINSAVSNATGTSGTQTLTIGGAGNTTVGGVMSNNAGTLALTMSGSGTLTFNGSAVNTFSGGVKVNGGTLALNFANLVTPTDLINNGNSLTMGGGMLSILGKNVASATSSQTFNGTTLNAGSNIIAINKGASATSATLNLGAITRNPGSAVNFQPNTAWTATPSTTEIVKTTGVTYDGVSYAVPGSGTIYVGAGFWGDTGSGIRYIQINSSGQFVLGPSSTAWTNSGSSATTVYNDGTTNQTLTASESMYAILCNNTNAQNLAITLGSASNAFTLTLNGMLHLNTGSVTLQQGTAGGTVQIGNEKDLVINASSTGGITISAPIINNGANASAVTINSFGTGVTTLSGVNAYTGGTFVNQGTLALGPTGSLANTAVAVGNGTSSNGTLVLNGSYTIGSGTAASLTVNGGTSTTGQGTLAFSSTEANPSTLSLNGALTLGSSTAPALLNFNMGNTSVDSITTNSLTINAGRATLSLSQLAGTTIAAGTSGSPDVYTLMTSANTITNAAGLTFSGGATGFVSNGVLYRLSNTSTTELLSVSTLSVPTNAYWYGINDASWSSYNAASVTNPTNWVTAVNNTTDAGGPPGATTNVFFNANAATSHFATTLDGNVSILSLTFNSNTAGANAVSIAPGTPLTSALTIGSGGITVNSGAGANSISAAVVLGAGQSWSNSSASLLTASGGVTGTANLALNANSTGGITLSTTSLNNTGSLTISGSGSGPTIISAPIGSAVTTISDTAAGNLTLSGATIANTGAITFSGTGSSTVTFSAAAINTTNTITNNGTTSGTTTISGVIGTNVTGVVENSVSIHIDLGQYYATSGLTIKAGTVNGTGGANSFGAGSITLGDSAADTANATLSGNSGAVSYANPIVLASGTTGTLTIQNLDVSTAQTFSGGVTGNNSFTITDPSTGTTATTTFSTNPINNAGTITVAGTTQSGAVTISGGVGGGTSGLVTGVLENSTTAPLTISTTALTVAATGTTLTDGLGAKLFTVSGGIGGTGNLILNNNSATASNITLSTTAANNTGTISTNSGTPGSTLTPLWGRTSKASWKTAQLQSCFSPARIARMRMALPSSRARSAWATPQPPAPARSPSAPAPPTARSTSTARRTRSIGPR